MHVINVGIRLYNKMLTRITQLDSFKDFKCELKLFFNWIILFIH